MLITSYEIETVIKKLPKRKGPDLMDSVKFYQNFKNELTPLLLKLFQEI
jgi:hypothetical protein